MTPEPPLLLIVDDEPGILEIVGQARLLRLLEFRDVPRAGPSESGRLDVHVLAATNRDLFAEMAAGRFRSDLYYRLNAVEIKLPALRDRREDIPYLTAAFRARVGRSSAQADHRRDAGGGAIAMRGSLERERPRAASRSRARLHPR